MLMLFLSLKTTYVIGVNNMTKKAEFTPWNIPQSDWTLVLEGVDIDEQTRQELTDAVRNFDRTELDERLRTFDITVSNETMSKSVK